MKVELLYLNGCPNWKTADRPLHSLARELGFEVQHRLVSTPEQAELQGFRGSPSIVVDGRDLFARGDEPIGMSCRLYETPDGRAGAPTTEMLRTALAAAS
jgi:hypothetical protein